MSFFASQIILVAFAAAVLAVFQFAVTVAPEGNMMSFPANHLIAPVLVVASASQLAVRLFVLCTSILCPACQKASPLLLAVSFFQVTVPCGRMSCPAIHDMTPSPLFVQV
ncbi:hypothetical protein BHU16_08755 [Tannerella sp. oral taxon 808]|nr:hypothetical protein BHU16_08755 [Tannerella sp. oral taxon 808]